MSPGVGTKEHSAKLGDTAFQILECLSSLTWQHPHTTFASAMQKRYSRNSHLNFLSGIPHSWYPAFKSLTCYVYN